MEGPTPWRRGHMPSPISESPGIQDLIRWVSLYSSTEVRGAKGPTQDHTVSLWLS